MFGEAATSPNIHHHVLTYEVGDQAWYNETCMKTGRCSIRQDQEAMINGRRTYENTSFAEVYVFYCYPEKTHVFYGGFYHLVARIIDTTEGPDRTLIDDNFEVYFSEKNDLLSAEFPRPALQMNFTGFIPWVLNEKRAALDSLVVSL